MLPLEAELAVAAPTPLVYFVGAGPVAAALAGRLLRAGVPVLGLLGRRAETTRWAAATAGVVGSTAPPPVMAEADVIVIAVKDEAAPEITRRLLDQGRIAHRQVLLHTSGAWPAGIVFREVRAQVAAVGTLHPLLSLNQGSRPQALEGATCAIEGDARAELVAARLVLAMRARFVRLEAAAMPLYHAGAALASNALVALFSVAARVLAAAGVPASQAGPALVPLVRSTLMNIERLGLPAALTGPIARADVETVERHLQALADEAGLAAEVYRLLGREIVTLATAREPAYPQAAVQRLRALLGGAG